MNEIARNASNAANPRNVSFGLLLLLYAFTYPEVQRCVLVVGLPNYCELFELFVGLLDCRAK